MGQGPDVTEALNPRTRMLLEAPIAPTLLRLAAPNVLVMLAQAGVGLIETYFVGKLGTDALAGMALVFPVVMLMQMTSAGAMGGGIASAIARALGARRRDDADALVLHSLVIAAVFSLIFTVGVVGGGRWLYTRMGGTGGSHLHQHDDREHQRHARQRIGAQLADKVGLDEPDARLRQHHQHIGCGQAQQRGGDGCLQQHAGAGVQCIGHIKPLHHRPQACAAPRCAR